MQVNVNDGKMNMTNKNKVIVFGMYSTSLILSSIAFILPYISAYLGGWNFERGDIFSHVFDTSILFGFCILLCSIAISTLIAHENKLFHNGKTNDKN